MNLGPGLRRHVDRLGLGRVGEQRLVDVEHRVPRAVLGQVEDWLAGLHHLPDLAFAPRDDARHAGLE